ncbi:hypothetical protein SAMN05660642_02970 [Geodermatophilus siccatus]|uniref:Uncharacterized protein n=1 Tax=Geodermatophilus siccatus TaxID=1137991 RepID=A0A1G9UW03_9ACTN|nr:hypothetical protein [Geodermatophilus siccatus]SDM63990.1 hypothetical protein SAMN05660642_02970 [Geodermatophilus siccatus]
MDPDDWSKVVLAAIPVVGAVAKLLRGAVPGRRGRLVSDADLLAKLPPDSDAYKRMLGHLDDEVACIIEEEDRRRRDVVGVVLGVALLAGAAALAVSAWHSDRDVSPFLWAAAAVVALLGTVGLVQDAMPQARDDAGRPIR